LCAAFGLDPLGAIASGGLIVSVASEAAEGLLALYAGAGVPCAAIGVLTPSGSGMWLERAGQREPLPRYDSDEISRLF